MIASVQLSGLVTNPSGGNATSPPIFTPKPWPGQPPSLEVVAVSASHERNPIETR